MPQKPNLVVVISDQFRADNLGCMGNPMGLTPNLDAMAARGTLFSSAVANNPLCAPARACMFSGQYQEKNGVWRNQLYLQPGANTLAAALCENGYTANYIGKWHLAPNGRTPETFGPVAPEYRGGFLDFWEASMPSLLEAMAVATPATVQGKSFLPLLRTAKRDWRNEAYIAVTGPVTGKALRTAQWTYAVGTPKVGGWKPAASSDSYVEYMMYDLYADPAQLINMAGRSETQQISKQFCERLAARVGEAGGVRPTIAPASFPYI